ncbi:hypothetical protein [Marinicauda algicola]|nr:hypothetical protein [Marinicauda algicola]
MHWSPDTFWSSTPGEFLRAAAALRRMHNPQEAGSEEWDRWKRKTFGDA